jgi:hypothetical protein
MYVTDEKKNLIICRFLCGGLIGIVIYSRHIRRGLAN